jgi:hypothetical protein
MRAVQAGVAMANPYAFEPSKMDLWAEDQYHPSNWGAYLNACVLFGEITGRDLRTLGGGEQAAVTLGIAPVQAVALQRIASEQVRAERPTAFFDEEKCKSKPSKTKTKTKS